MFERFTDRARRVIVLAQEETRLMGHDYIGTEHLLLGLIHESEGVAGRVLDELGVHLAEARNAVEGSVGRGEKAPHGHIPFSQSARKLLENSMREALKLGHPYIGTEHLLLSLTETDGTGLDILAEAADITELRQQVRQRVMIFLEGYSQTPIGRAPEPVADDALQRPWRPGDADTRCQGCGYLYHPWFTDNWLWNTVMGDGENNDDPGGFLCPRCFADRAAEQHPNLVWRFIPEWSGKAPLMDFKREIE